MRILIAAIGSHGDVLPFATLGHELASRGHDVVFYANPVFSSCVTHPSIRFVPMGTREAHEALFQQAPEDNPTRAFKHIARYLMDMAPAYHDAMAADVVPGQTICMGGSLMFAHRLLRETLGVPCATVHLAPSVLRSAIHPARLGPHAVAAHVPAWLTRVAWRAMDVLAYDPFITAPLNRWRRQLGLPPVKRVFKSWLHEADGLVAMFPEWFAQREADWPAQLVMTGFPLHDSGYALPLPARLQDFLADGPPPVAFSPGTANASAESFFRTSVQACDMAGMRGILLSPFAGHVPASLPRQVIHVDYAPFGALLPRLAALVHHGGIGTTSQALRAGVPQLIRPVAYDQFDNAARAVKLGVATELLPNRYTADRLARALTSIATDAPLQSRCREMARHFVGNDAVADTCDAILERVPIKGFPQLAGST